MLELDVAFRLLLLERHFVALVENITKGLLNLVNAECVSASCQGANITLVLLNLRQ